jgi:hypothetical protein
MKNQFMTKKWDLEKLLAKREGIANNTQNGPEITRTLSTKLLKQIDEAIKLRVERGETWDKYWSRDKGGWVTFKDHVVEIKKNAPPLTAKDKAAIKAAQNLLNKYCD